VSKELLVDEDCPGVRARRQYLENERDAVLDDPVHELGHGWMWRHLRYCEQCATFRQEYGADNRAT